MILLAIAAAGFAGAVARYWLSTTIASRFSSAFPRATFLINISGAFALGLLVGSGLPAALRTPLAAGFCGAYTTFSTWMLETVRLSPRTAVLNLVLSTATGLLAAAGGLALGRWLL
ncbi:MAG: CrcB protein [Symbiobacteriaceae bacterium]|jgi:CrcB protein|nr:CrcB protein [Symbiobacteriaceae bacterium]